MTLIDKLKTHLTNKQKTGALERNFEENFSFNRNVRFYSRVIDMILVALNGTCHLKLVTI